MSLALLFHYFMLNMFRMLICHIRVLAESFDSRLADVGKPLVRQLGSYLS